MVMPIPQISADSIASIGDPWVAEAHKRRVQDILGQSGGDYRKAALALMSIDPASASQLIKLSGQDQAAGHQAAELALRSRGLDIQQSAEDRPVVQTDEDSGYSYVLRPVSQQGRWLTGPNAGQPLSLGAPMPRMMGGGAPSQPAPQRSPQPAPAPLAPRSANPAPALASAPPPAPASGGEGMVELKPGLSIPNAEVEALRQNPQFAPQFETHYNLPAGTAQQLITGGKRTDAGDEVIPSATYPGGVARMAGPGVEDLPPEIGQAFAQASPQQGSVDLAPGRQDAPNLTMKNRRAVEEARLKEYYRKQADQQIKDITAAENIEPYLPAARTAQRLLKEAARTGNIHPIWGNDTVTTGLKYARGALDIAGMHGQDNPIQSPLITDPLRKSMAQLELLRAQAMKGQGSITESERGILRRSLPTLDAANPQEALQQMQELMDVLERIAQRGNQARRARPGS